MTVTSDPIHFWLPILALLAAVATIFPALMRRRERLASAGAPASATAGPGGIAGNAVLDHIPDPIILVDRRASVLGANRAARRLLPALKERQPLSLALRSPDALEALNTVLWTGEPRTVDLAQRVPLERRFEIQITALDAGRPDADETPSILLFFRDLTPAWRIERMRADFVANASHELRTPLASILGFIETLQGPARDDPAARERFLATMHGQAKRMARLIDDLLSLARIEMRAHLPITAEVDLQAVAAQVVDELTPLAQDRSVEIAQGASDGSFRVLGDRDELQRAVENVVENAIKYGESGRKIEVGLKRLDDAGRKPAVELLVRDFGPGIAPEHLPRLTERFYRVDPTSSRQQGGTGLGLAIVKHIVSRHRGRLAIDSEPGRGTTVRIILPAQAPMGDVGRGS
jgi:two-component system, OmpR family, phosphate regulon sensor histidine kinase PhoR